MCPPPERSHLKWTLTTLLVACGLHLVNCNNVLLPKRLVAQIGSKVNLQFSDNEIENAFLLGKDMVTRNTRLENDLIRDGTSARLVLTHLLNGPALHRFCDQHESGVGH